MVVQVMTEAFKDKPGDVHQVFAVNPNPNPNPRSPLLSTADEKHINETNLCTL